MTARTALESTGQFRPVFIFGCDRSGTTMLGAMLGAGDMVVTTPESQFVIDCYYEREGEEELVRASRAIAKHPRFAIWQIPMIADRITTESGNNKPYASIIRELVQKYAEAHGKFEPRIWVDHTPTHGRFAFRLARLFPEAKFIHLVRDGRAVAASILNLGWGPNTPLSAADWWAKKVSVSAAAEVALGASRAMRVSFEELVTDPETTLRNICNFVSIEFTEAMIRASGFSVPEYTKAQHDRVGSKPDPARANDWRGSLSPRQIELFEYQAGDVLSYFGYQAIYGYEANAPSWMERRYYGIRDPIQSRINYFRAKYRILRALYLNPR